MNQLPEDLTGFDFAWSACALEHLGTLEAGMRFVERSMECLRPGGIAVHTTEFNVDSDKETVAEGGTVLYRRQDLVRLGETLESRGHRMLPLTEVPRDGMLDRIVDVPPYHRRGLMVRIGRFRSTSLIIVVRARP
jgi:SAM-dependent methyltransferase